MGTGNLGRMRDKGMVWVPTVFTMAAYADLLGRGSPASDVARRNLEHQPDTIRRAFDIGLTMAVGTDSGTPGVHHGRAVSEEIGLLVAAGLPLPRAVQCGSSNGAKLLGLEKEVGRLVAGMPPTMIVSRGEPEKLAGSLASPEAVYAKTPRPVGGVLTKV
jgi:imidazolonepropionase-like amidohydrolase